MSDSKKDGETENNISITTKPIKKFAPLGYSIELSEAHAQIIAEFVSSPAYGILKKHLVMQRRDQIARTALSQSETNEQLQYFKGMAAELVLFFKVLGDVQKEFKKHQTPDQNERRMKK